jgi:hypothetical protein
LQVLIRHPLPTQYVLQMDISQEKMMNRWILGNVNPWMSKPWLFLFRGCSHSQVASGAKDRSACRCRCHRPTLRS